MSLSSAPRRGAVVLWAASMLVGCAHPGFRASAVEPSASNSEGSKSDGSKSDDSKSDGSKSEGSKSDGSQSDGSSDGSSDSRSETSGTVTTGKEGDDTSSSAGLFILTGALLLGATTVVGLVLLLNRGEPVAYTTRHERGIRLALTRGEGPFVLDVADNLRLPRELLPTLGDALRRARPELEPHLIAADAEKGFTTEDGRYFAEKLARVLHAEPRLTPYVQRLMNEIAVVVGTPATP